MVVGDLVKLHPDGQIGVVVSMVEDYAWVQVFWADGSKTWALNDNFEAA